MALTAAELRGIFTKELVDVYQERIRPTGFLRSMFQETPPVAKLVSIEVERTNEKIAVDVVRGSEPNMNRFARSTEKVFEPPYWREGFDVTQLDLYDRLMGSLDTTNTRLFNALLNKASDRLGSCQDKIERSIELMCSQAIFTSIVTIEQASANIDYGRNALSMVDPGGSNYFANNIDAFAQLEAGCKWIRTKGKVGAKRFTAIFGQQAFHDFINNTKVLARQNLFNMALDTIHAPIANSVGAVYHGSITCGPYMVDVWTYPEFYDTETQTNLEYVPTNYVAILPPKPRFTLAHGLCPELIAPGGGPPAQGNWLYKEKLDEWMTSHLYSVETAALAIPVAIDTIYTLKAVA